MVHAEGFVYIRTGLVTVYPIPVARIAVFNSASDEEKARLVTIAYALNQYNDITSSRKETKH